MLGASGCDIYGQDIGTALMSILITRKQALWETINSVDGVVRAYFIVMSKYGLTFFIFCYLVEIIFGCLYLLLISFMPFRCFIFIKTNFRVFNVHQNVSKTSWAIILIQISILKCDYISEC